MLAAIAGDIIGSPYEARPIKQTDFQLFCPRSRFTDDSVLTLATANAILTGVDYLTAYKYLGRKYPDAGYGGSFIQWLLSDSTDPYNSFGNGSAMRVSPVGWAYDSQSQVLAQAKSSAAVTHNHPEGIKGAQAVALAIFLARTGSPKKTIREELARRFDYNLEITVADIRPAYSFDSTCQGSVPQAMVAFFDSTDFENAVRLAVSLGGDSDTLAAITASVAQAFYRKVPAHIVSACRSILPKDLLAINDAFTRKYRVPAES